MNETEIRDFLITALDEIAPTVSLSTEDHAKPLVDLGFDSLDQSGILLAIEEHYDIKIPDEDVDRLVTLEDYVQHLSTINS